MIKQRNPLSPPLDTDELLSDYSAVLQSNLEQLFEAAHMHGLRTSAPSENEGTVGDILPVQIDSTYYLYAKFPTVGWKRVALS